MKKNLTISLTIAACSLCVTFSARALNLTNKAADHARSAGPVSESGAAQQTASTSDKPGGGSGGGALSQADRAFLLEAAKGGMKEVAMGQMAQQHAQSSGIKSYGGRLVNDHTK